MITRGDLFPHIQIRRIDGTPFAYEDIWQRRNLLLVSLAGARDEHEASYIAGLVAHAEAFEEYEATVVVTRESIPGLPSPAILVADRWGEIIAVEPAHGVASLPDVDALVEWMRFVAHACPECEGEAH